MHMSVAVQEVQLGQLGELHSCCFLLNAPMTVPYENHISKPWC